EGDTFYLAHEEAFAKEGADVTLHATVRALPPPRLVWEGFDPELQRWHPIVVESDETGSFTKSGSIKISAPKIGLPTVNGVRAVWIRVRLAEGGYNFPPSILAFLIETFVGPFRPPRLGFANQTPVTFDRPFLPFGENPGPGDIFYFGEQEGFRD